MNLLHKSNSLDFNLMLGNLLQTHKVELTLKNQLEGGGCLRIYIH